MRRLLSSLILCFVFLGSSLALADDSCKTDTDCAIGSFCKKETCVETSLCTVDWDCPGDFSCDTERRTCTCYCEDDPRCCFEFGDDDSITTDSGKAERTFSLPPVKAGFVVDVYNWDLLPHISLGLKDFSISKFGSWGDFSIDVGVATSRAFLSLTWELIPIVKTGPMIWAGYNVREVDAAFGIGFSMLDF